MKFMNEFVENVEKNMLILLQLKSMSVVKSMNLNVGMNVKPQRQIKRGASFCFLVFFNFASYP